MTMFCKQIEYPKITLQALVGFDEDSKTARCFTNRFLPWSLSCVAALLCFGACIAAPCWLKQYDPVPQIYIVLAATFFALSVVLFFATWRRMVNGAPVSLRSGLPMEVYQLEDTIKDEKYELIYVCRKSRSYFRIVYKAPGD